MTATNPAPQGTEEAVVNQFGYKQELRRALKYFSVFSVSFSIISITTGIFLNFGFGFGHLGPAMIWTWPVAGVGQLLVCLVLAELATRIPLAGANYQWGARLVSPTYGWFVGSLGIMYGAVGLPAIMYLAAAPLTEYVFNVSNPSGRLTLFVALLFITVAYLINVISVQLAARVNNVAVFTEIVGTVVLAVLLFFLWVGNHKHTDHGLGYIGHHFHLAGQPYWYAITLASLIGIFTIVGFEVAADLSEEAVDARRSVPRAMIGSVVWSTVLGMIVLIGFVIAVPSDKFFSDTGGFLPAMFQYWIGSGLARTFTAIVVFSMFALTVVGAAANARLYYAMSRDNMLPGSSLLRMVHPRTKTPMPALGASYVITVGVMIYGYNQANAFGTLVGATALVPFVVYFLTVVAYGWKRRGLEAMPGAFSLGKWAGPVFVGAFVWLVVAILALSLPKDFHGADRYVGYGIGLAAIWWAVGLYPRLRRHTAGVTHIPEQRSVDLTTTDKRSTIGG
ncbi:MAG TPA: amino acid permease [Mycobacteriales bacterium]|nr:amino acid permease [Mycobacteriales bacterium]